MFDHLHVIAGDFPDYFVVVHLCRPTSTAVYYSLLTLLLQNSLSTVKGGERTDGACVRRSKYQRQSDLLVANVVMTGNSVTINSQVLGLVSGLVSMM